MFNSCYPCTNNWCKGNFILYTLQLILPKAPVVKTLTVSKDY